MITPPTRLTLLFVIIAEETTACRIHRRISLAATRGRWWTIIIATGGLKTSVSSHYSREKLSFALPAVKTFPLPVGESCRT